MQKIDCKKYADELLEQISKIPYKNDLLIVTTGHDPASEVYVRGKLRDAERCGIRARTITTTDPEVLRAAIKIGNELPSIGGIIVQLPLTKGFDEDKCVNLVDIQKDVDGFRAGSPFKPCTPEGILFLLKQELGDLAGKTVLLIGKGKLVGKPLITMLLDEGCTLTIAHSKTVSLKTELLRHHDIVITAVGAPRLVNLKRTNASIVIDAGISRDSNGVLCGDCYNFDPDTRPDMRVATIPQGVGLLTRAMLMAHVAYGGQDG